MVSIYGLNKRIGNISFYDSQGRDSFTKPYSDETARVIDEEVSKIIEEQYQRALQILSDNKDKLMLLAEKLLEKEVIFKEDLEEIFGKRPWVKDEEFVSKSKLESAENNLIDAVENTIDSEITSEVSTGENTDSLIDTTENKES
jgi:cell division protease FtsH